MAANGQESESCQVDGNAREITSAVQNLYMPNQAQDGLANEIQDLSPTTQENFRLIVKSVKQGEAQIDMDKTGKPVLEYKQARKIWWDASNANVIAVPNNRADVQVKVDACLELMEFMKTEKPPSGVVLDTSKITLSKGRQYKEGVDFVKTRQVLGKGNSAGAIMKVTDKGKQEDHAQKTVMLSVFRAEEIRCWVDLSHSGCVPSLYLFRIENNKIVMHMEILSSAKTLRSVIDDHMAVIYKSDPSLLKPFSLYFLDSALEAVSTMHKTGWTHKDLHGGNVMVQKTSHDALQVKILDFGSAGRLKGPSGLDFGSFRADIANVVRQFSALYTAPVGQEFDNVDDFRCNWKQRLEQISHLSESDKKLLFCIIDGAMKIVHPSDVEGYRNQVKSSLQQGSLCVVAMGDCDSESAVMKKVVALLFPEEFIPVNVQPQSEPDGLVVVRQCKTHDVDEADSFTENQPSADLDLEQRAALVPDEITLSKGRQYIEEGVDFVKTWQVLGKGNSAGAIMIVKDKGKQEDHAQKTVMLSLFRAEEIRCWVDLSDSGCVPSLYLFRIENNKIVMHMEILSSAKTLRSVIDDHMAVIYKSDPSLLKPFSLYVLDGALEAVSTMHKTGWTHKDLHGGNVMVQKTSHDALQVKILDFGSAGRSSGLDFISFRADIAGVVRLFSALYTAPVGQEFDNVVDIQCNWKQRLEQISHLSESDKKELFCLIDGAMKIVLPSDVEGYRNQVKSSLQQAMGDCDLESAVMKKVVALLFPEEFIPVHVQPQSEPDGLVVVRQCKTHDVDEADSFTENQPSVDLDLEQRAALVPDEVLLKIRLSTSIQLVN